MFKITIKNLSNIQTHGATFATMQEAQPWIDECVLKNKWGKKAGFYPESSLSPAELAQEISRQTLDELGRPLLEPLIEIPAQYTIEILDITQSHHMNLLRNERNLLLKECDYIMMPDYPLLDKSAWESYRNALRDLPANTLDPQNPSWPVKPS